MTVIPRLASTVVLMDESARVYLTKRPKTMKFFGGFYVFPGGAVDIGDHTLNNEDYMKGKREESFDSAHYVAAARELFEEVGVFLGTKEDGTNVQLDPDKEKVYRNQLMKDEISFFQLLKQENLQLNVEDLTYFGHLVTPKENRIRFDTRFFLAQLPKGQVAKPDEVEIEEASWFSPEDALSDYQYGKIALPPPTILALKTISDYKNGEPLMMMGLEEMLKWKRNNQQDFREQ